MMLIRHDPVVPVRPCCCGQGDEGLTKVLDILKWGVSKTPVTN